MIKIERKDIVDIANEYSIKVWALIHKNKLDKSEYNENTELLYRVQQLYMVPVNELKAQYNSFKEFVETGHFDEEQITNTFFDYKKAINWSIHHESLGYWLANRLNVKTCPYCNRQYTFTINADKSIRPQFDHYYPFSEYPYLRLSFFNLIPCCSICNHTKRNKELDIHPYEKSFGDDCKFEIVDVVNSLLSSGSFDSKIGLTFSSSNKNISELGLKELYDQHSDYVSEIVYKAKAYNEGYYNSIKETFSGFELTPAEMNLLIFGNYIEVAKHENRPLSKLTKDILDQLKG